MRERVTTEKEETYLRQISAFVDLEKEPYQIIHKGDLCKQ